jgi:hypothetical protein
VANDRRVEGLLSDHEADAEAGVAKHLKAVHKLVRMVASRKRQGQKGEKSDLIRSFGNPLSIVSGKGETDSMGCVCVCMGAWVCACVASSAGMAQQQRVWSSGKVEKGLLHR